MDGLDLSDRIDERKIAQTLKLSDEEAAEYGFQSGDEPIVYDLCESYITNFRAMADWQMRWTITLEVWAEVITLHFAETRSMETGTTTMTQGCPKQTPKRSR